MKRYLLDTSLLVAYLHNRVQARAIVSPIIERGEAATSMLVYGEVIEYLKGLPKYPEKYQSPEKEAKNPYARWFCKVVSPICPQSEVGDVYVSTVKASTEPWGTLPIPQAMKNCVWQ